MVTDILQPTHLLFILVVALLVLGPKRLPEVARTLGNGLRDFRSAISGEHNDEPSGRPEHIAAADEPEAARESTPSDAVANRPAASTATPPPAGAQPPASAQPPAEPTNPPTQEQPASEPAAAPAHDPSGPPPA